MNEEIKKTEEQILNNIELYLERKEKINTINDIVCPEFPKKTCSL